MLFGKVCIKHFECACRNILSFETVLLDSCVNVDVSHCFIMDIQVPPVPSQPKTFRFLQRTFGVNKKKKEKFTAVVVRQLAVVTF